MYVVMRGRTIICHLKFVDRYDAKVWCLHNGYARMVTINKQGDKVIELKPGINIEQMG